MLKLKESTNVTRGVAWLNVNHNYQIRTEHATFSKAKVIGRHKGVIDVEYFGPSLHTRKPNTPLCVALQPVKRKAQIRIIDILEARELC